MGITVYKHKDKESASLSQLVRFFDWEKNLCVPRVMLFHWESDLLVVTPAGFVTEVEVKVSMADWKADSSKSKFIDPGPSLKFKRVIKRFYYAVPQLLYSRFLEQPWDLPAGAGILVHGTWGSTAVSEVRAPVVNHNANALSDSDLRKLYRSVYFRYTRTSLRGGIPCSQINLHSPDL